MLRLELDLLERKLAPIRPPASWVPSNMPAVDVRQFMNKG